MTPPDTARARHPWVALGALAGLLAVALSAYAAHALTPAQLSLAQNALTMQGWHALALLFTGLYAARRPGWPPHAAAACFVLGMLLFCGAVWFTILAGHSPGPIAPVGGTLLMLGWLCLAFAAMWR